MNIFVELQRNPLWDCNKILTVVQERVTQETMLWNFKSYVVVPEKLSKAVFYFSSNGHIAQTSETVWAILVEGRIRNIFVKVF